MKIVWATRGRTWGFRFLRDGGYADPLQVRDQAFSSLDDQVEVYRRVGPYVALRFTDPEGRRDASGRPIPHEFVIVSSDAAGIDSVDEGRRLVWPQVAAELERIWDLPEP